MSIVLSKTKGSIAHAFCTAYCVSQGYIVSQPLFDNASYDLIIDNGTVLLKVQSKFTNVRTSPIHGQKVAYPRVPLAIKSSRQTSDLRYYSVTSFDLLWVMTATSFYLIPSQEIFATKLSKLELRLYPKWDKFLVDFPHPNCQETPSRLRAARLTPSEQQRIETLFASGMTTEAIADSLGVTRGCVSVYLSRHGIQRTLASS